MSGHRFNFPRLLLACSAVLLLLAGCSNRSSTLPEPEVEPNLTVTSATETAARTYHLIGSIEIPDGATPLLEYALNGGAWQPITVTLDKTFSVVLTLNEGSNQISVALEVGETRIEKELTVNVEVSETPVIAFTSGVVSQSAAYRLTGIAVDDFGVEKATYRLNDGDAVNLVLSDGMFDTTLTLIAGSNEIAVTAEDAAGNSTTESLTVTYEPPISGVAVEPMVARRNQLVTISGSHFGPDTGTVLIGTEEATVHSWSDSEIVVAAPGAFAGGWMDIEIHGTTGTAIVEDFFVGIEIASEDLTAAITAANPEPGEAFLLSGPSYVLTQLPTIDPSNFLSAFSYYGAPTDGAPETVLESSDGVLLFSTHAALRTQFQDLVIRADVVHIATFGELLPLDAATDVGLRLENVVFEREAAPGFTDAERMLNIGPRTDGSSLDLYQVPAQTTLVNVESSGFFQVAVGGGNVRLIDSTIRLPANSTANALVVMTDGLLDITESEILAEASPLMLLSSNLMLQLDGAEISLGDGILFMGRFLNPQVPTIRANDSRLQVGASGTMLATGGVNSAFEGNSFSGGSLGFDLQGGNSMFTANQVDTGSVEFRTASGGLTVRDNELGLASSLALSTLDDSVLRFDNNTVTGPAFTSMTGPGTLLVQENDFDATGFAAGAIFRIAASPASSSVGFHNNTSVGSDRLFSINGSGGGELNVNITGNTFAANLTTLGDVAVVTDLVAPSIVTTSDNTWGQLESAAEVHALIEFVNTVSDRMTVAP